MLSSYPQLQSRQSLALTALCYASDCELGESGLEQGGDGGVVEVLGAGKGSGAIVSNDARICIRCKESPDNLDVALLGCQHQRCYPSSIGMVYIGARFDESLDHS